MKYLCVNCNYIYDEAIGDSGEGIEAGTKIDEIISCPVCEEYDTFHHINEEITYLGNDLNDKFEVEHFIEVNHIDDTVEVIIGGNTHPMGEDHRIAWVGLYDEYGDLVEERFLNSDDDSAVTFDDYSLDEIEIRIKCTQHKLFAKKFVL
ncbi:MAG: rubredoxin [Candidatus Gracilibacteria bacterium]|nr:rubredoxin [Candidatus Gracilibacteria bacterium]